MIRKYLFLVLLLIFLSSCTTAKSKTIVPLTTITPTSESLPSSTTPIPTKEAESGIVILISGTVKDISLSARVITLNELVNDFSTIALTEECELAFSNGREITLHDIQPGMTIQVAGQPGESNTLLAHQVLVLNSTPIASNNQPGDQQTAFPQMEAYSFMNKGSWTVYTPAHWQKQYEQKSGFPTISSIVADLEGAVWFATMGGSVAISDGVYRFDGENWAHFSQKNGLPSDEISSMVLTSDGTIWFSTLCCGVASFDGETWEYYTTTNGLESNDVRSMAVAPDGKLWLGTSENGVSVFDGTKWTTLQTDSDMPRDYVGDISTLPNGDMLFSSSANSFAKLIQYDGIKWQTYPTPWETTGKYVMDVAKTPDENIWFAMETIGAYRLSGETWRSYSTQDGLSSNYLLCVDIASDGSVWFGTTKGISHYDGTNWESFLNENEWEETWITAIATTSDGTIWFGSSGKVIRYMP